MKTIEIAKTIIFLCQEHYYYEISSTKVHKLLYLILGFSLMNDVTPTEYVQDVDGEDIKCVMNELPRAWPYGPAFPQVYKQYHEIIETDFKSYTPFIGLNDKYFQKIITETVKQWGKNSASSLSKWSHEENSPWDFVVKHCGSGWDVVIPPYIIREYFELNIANIID
jgi:uncharacterized phage-associated protein